MVCHYYDCPQFIVIVYTFYWNYVICMLKYYTYMDTESIYRQ